MARNVSITCLNFRACYQIRASETKLTTSWFWNAGVICYRIA